MTKKHHTHLSLSERREIYNLLGRNVPVCKIAKQLGRHHSTIYREIQRNTTYHEDHFHNGYFHLNAQEYYRRRRQSQQLFERHPALKELVIDKLKQYWSPEQIAGYLKRIGYKGLYACMETIYRFIYSHEGKKLNLYSYLYKGRKNRRKKYSRKPRGQRIPENLGIAFRPTEIMTRQSFGHWEGDLMIFNREHGNYNITSLIERKSRYTVLARNDNRKPDFVAKTINKALSNFPEQATKSITFDRGFEFMSYPLLKKARNMDSYFCDPQAPWQKGAVECNNSRLRRFLPRETDLKEISSADLYAISTIMNNTPRKCLGYRTPQEVLNEHLQMAA